MSDIAAQPLRVGLVGLNRHGLHLIERCLADGPFRVVTAYDSDATRAAAATGLNVPVVSDINELVYSTDIDVVWIAQPSVHLLDTLTSLPNAAKPQPVWYDAPRRDLRRGASLHT